MPQLYVVVLAIIVTALLAVAIYRASRVKTKADYLVAGRSLPAQCAAYVRPSSQRSPGNLQRRYVCDRCAGEKRYS